MTRMKPALWTGAILLALALATAALLLARPWAEYSPLKLNSLFAPERRVENFRSMERIMPYRVVRAAALPFEFREAPRPLPAHYGFQGERRSLDEFLARVNATGLLVIQDDAVVHERYLLGATRDTRHTSWSVAKSFVATLVAVALQEGRIRSLDEPITDYAPSLRGSAYDGVPIRHVLQMSSGVAFDETYGDRRSDINRLFLKVFALNRRIDRVLHDYGRERPSGALFHYISVDTQALGLMLREIYRRPLAQLLEQKLWQPLGMEGDALWNTDRAADDGIELAFCCLNARLRDYAKLGRLYLEQGRWQGRQLLPEGWVREATTPARADLEPGVSPYDYGPRGYQYQWWVPENYQREYFAAGVWGQYVYVSEPDRLIIVRSSVDPNFRANLPETLAVFRVIRDALRNAPAQR
jgi:CubicO group peptidase (beta-lactamase class C family)